MWYEKTSFKKDPQGPKPTMNLHRKITLRSLRKIFFSSLQMLDDSKPRIPQPTYTMEIISQSRIGVEHNIFFPADYPKYILWYPQQKGGLHL